MSTRREFLRDCASLAAGVTLAPDLVLRASAGVREVPLERISFAAFAERVGAVFRVYDLAGSPLQLTLAKAECEPPVRGVAATRAHGARNEKFALLFTGPQTSPLEQETYWFEHPELGLFPMFIVPVGGHTQDARTYEAIFNRPTSDNRGRPMNARSRWTGTKT